MVQSNTVTIQGDPLFRNAHDALRFAFNFSGQAYDRPMMNRIAAPALGSGKGLVGLDGAAQAGMIRSEVQALGRLPEAVIIARISPRYTPCSCGAACCSKKRPNREWVESISYLADHVRRTALAGCTSNGLMRREYVVRYFTRKDDRASLDSLAAKYNVSRNTVSAHSTKVATWLGGVPAQKDKPDKPTMIGMERAAFDAIEHRLFAIGMVGQLSA